MGEPKTETENVEASKIKIMVMMNRQLSFDSALAFLNRRGYEVVVVNTIAEAIKKLLIVKPHIMLLSWNLKNADVRKIHTLVTEKFKVICIAFAEINTTKSAASLISSGFPNTILPPVSGPTIHMRIQHLLRKKKEVVGSNRISSGFGFGLSRKPAEGSSDDFGLNEVPDSEVASDTKWESKDNITWKGGSLSTNKTYYFKGPQTPTFDNAAQKWNFPEKIGSMLSQNGADKSGFKFAKEGQKSGNEFSMSQAELGTEFSMNEAPPVSEGEVDWEKEAAAAERDLRELEKSLTKQVDIDEEGEDQKADETDTMSFDDSDDLEETSGDSEGELDENLNEDADVAGNPSPIRKKRAIKRHSVLEQSVKEALENSVGLCTKDNSLLSSVTHYAGLLIESNKYKGYLVCVTSNNSNFTKEMADIFDKLSAKMKNYGQPIKPEKQIIEFTLPSSDFQAWAPGKSEFYFVVKFPSIESGFAFFPVNGFAHLQEQENTDVVSLSLEKDIDPDQRLLFDLYLHLPKNDKFILYQNTNTVFNSKTIQKLLKFGVKRVFIKASQTVSFLTYSASCHIRRKIL